VPHTIVHGLVAKALQRIDVELTDEQQLAFEDVKRDLRAPVPMRRVLTGEVGAGKGLVSLLSTVLVAENKHQVMVLSPDQATAEQRFAFTEPVLRDLGLVARLYTTEPSEAQRDAIRRGEVHVLFGSTQLLEAGLEFRRLGLVMAGERDVYGAVDKQIAAMRPPLPDLLVITSTPVPQPVLMAAYPSFDLTLLRALPGKPVPCEVVTSDERNQAYAGAAEAVGRGEQVVVVFPMHRGADVLDVREALRVVATLESRVFEGARVKLFHGAMSREERYRTYTDFRDHRLDVLVATTHFEAGPAVPGVSTVIVEQADRMRLSRLHRIRGHISVGRFEPRCILITGEHPDTAGVERVQQFARSREGFAVSVQELDDRGLADMVDENDATEPAFQWLDARVDLDTLLLSRADARRLLEADPGLRKGPNLELARYLKVRWSDLVGTDSPVQISGGGTSSRRRRRRRKR
jgi:ATP-dependent DNA helicase RecG